jgi:hypothetical protein
MKVCRRRWHVTFESPLEGQGPGRADHAAEPAPNATALVYFADQARVRHFKGPELAPLEAVTAARACVGVDDRKKAGTGNRGGDAEFGYAAEHAAAARTAVSYVVVSIPIVTWRVHQSGIFCLA